ncbi:type I restriction endonuclease subunit R [Pseudomonas sp. 5Ae-yellow]|uniref:type I restriction endonuclease subunit R n=1 Tax=Pseudomonas sp. 5Ae-yellow TaxID=2759848 RepID=UPI0015F78000|nr:type I restriction endonuclease subunit R [Pseudomonas sp. 5Ae-yellow]MBA6421702.1 type I restriction endonuclease subunit R [Pseudomonas sp. 5Ae-yellow]
MAFQDEIEKVEQPAIEQLRKLGWSYIPGISLAPLLPVDGLPLGERGYYRDVVLVNRLELAIKRLNPWISDENCRKVMREFTHPLHAGLMEYNHSIYQMLVNYMSVEQDLGKGRKGQTVRVIDFDNPAKNEFLCTNQFKVEGANQNTIPDIVCFVNGLPLAVIECKSPYLSSPMAEGIDQLRRYANLRQPETDEGSQRLFWYNQLMVSTCRDQARVGTISSTAQHYGDWKDAYPFTDADIRTLLNKLISDLDAVDGKTARDVPSAEYLVEAKQLAYGTDEVVEAKSSLPHVDVPQPEAEINAQQRLLAGMFKPATFLDLIQNFILYEPVDGRLIKKVARYQQYRAVNKVIERLKAGKNRKEKSGVVWHTQGSGKSLTMVMLAVKMRRDAELQQYKLVFITDRTQLDTQLSTTFRDAQNETIYNAGSVSELKDLLRKDASDIVTAMVQKFQDAEKESDFTDLNPSDKIIVLADEAHRTQFGNLAMTIDAALPNAPKIGFTGTPLLKTQKMSQAFGGYIDEYKINQAVEDGATVRLLYQGRQARVDVAGESLDSLFDAYFKEYSDEDRAEIKRKYGVEKAVREAPARVRRICMDLLEHYRSHIQPDGFKAMIVVGSRHAATVYKKALDELEAPPSHVIISGNHNDPQYLAQFADKTVHKNAIDDFKSSFKDKPQSPAFLIVKDMLLTGFDAPICQVMYIDRKLQDHTLMQAIARVNRTYPGKSAGFIVDYYGLSQYLTDALDLFSADDVEGTIHELKDEIPRLRATHTRVAQFFTSSVSKDVDDLVLLLKDEEKRAQFDLAFKRFAKQMNVVMPDKAALPFTADLKLWGKVNHSARLKYHDQQLTLGAEIGEKVRRLVDEHIFSTGVDPKIPPVDLMAANFKEHVQEIKSPESRASEIESAIKDHINVNLDQDPEYYKSLSLRLRDIIQKSEGDWDKQLGLLMALVDNIEHSHQKAAQDIGLSETEYAFYGILVAEVARATGEDVLNEETHEQIKLTVRELVEMFEDATQIVDLFKKDDEIKRMKKAIKHTVLDQPFGNVDIVKALQERFLDLARSRFA